MVMDVDRPPIFYDIGLRLGRRHALLIVLHPGILRSSSRRQPLGTARFALAPPRPLY